MLFTASQAHEHPGVDRLLSIGHPAPSYNGPERRKAPRSRVEGRFRIEPLEGIGGKGLDIYVTLKDLSKRGVCFVHETPLPFRLVRLIPADRRIDSLGLESMKIDLVLKWCRFIGPGHYESGGRIARSMVSETASVA